MEVEGVHRLVEWRAERPGGRIVELGSGRVLFQGGMGWRFGEPMAEHVIAASGDASGSVLSPMPGQIISLDVAEGDAVTRGQTLLVVEAMKMENRLLAPFDGIVASLQATLGQQVSEGVTLARIERVPAHVEQAPD